MAMSSVFRRRKNAGSDGGDSLEAAAAGATRSDSTAAAHNEDLGEYAALERYISTYRDERDTKGTEDVTEIPQKRRWWKFWKSSVRTPQMDAGRKDTIPDSWFATDIHAGLDSSAVEERRKLSGWNELTAESENLFVKFLTFFTGPILYGKHY